MNKKKTLNYKVLSASSAYDLTNQIEKLGDGWEPCGGVGVGVGVSLLGAQQLTQERYAQTMRRKKTKMSPIELMRSLEVAEEVVP